MSVRLRHDLDRWIEAGLISSDEAEAIASFETAESVPGLGFLAEGLGYVGAALAVGAGFLIAQNIWEDLSTAGRLSMIAALAVAMFGAGWALRTRPVPALQRLTDVLWVGATAATGAFAGLFGADVIGLVDEAIGVAVGLTSTVVGGVLWILRRRSLELIALAVGLLITVMSATTMIFGGDLSPVIFGSIIWGIGAAFFAAGHFDRIAPVATAMVVGAVGIGFGSQVLSAEGDILGAAFAVVTAGALMVYAVRQRDDLMLAIGGIMVLIFVPQLIFAVFGDSLGAPVALFLTGGALVVIAIAITKARITGRDQNERFRTDTVGTGEEPAE